MSRSTQRRNVLAVVLGVLLAVALVTPSVAFHTPQHADELFSALQERVQRQGERLGSHRDRINALRADSENYIRRMNPGAGQSETRVLAEHGPLTYLARCFNDDGGNDRLEWIVTSSREFFTSIPPSTLHAAGTEIVIASVAVATGDTNYPFFIDRANATSERDGQIWTLGFDQEGQINALNVFGQRCLIAGKAVLNRL